MWLRARLALRKVPLFARLLTNLLKNEAEVADMVVFMKVEIAGRSLRVGSVISSSAERLDAGCISSRVSFFSARH